MDCPRCRAANPDSSRFCGLCAAPLHPGEASTRPPAAGSPSAPGPDRSAAPSESHSDSPSLTTTIDPLARGLLSGTVVADKYRILGEIGRGGMGVVYEAEDVRLRRAVALKFLPLELTDDLEARERFVHEAQAASVLDNPHICTIHEIGEGEDRRMYIAMALCNGESLRTRIKRGPLAASEALSIAAQVADGLAAAHANGIIHRDIKPANILVTKEGAARIADFGLAKIAGEARLTRTGRAVGTVAYMSPEQLRGEDVDVRTDVWSLGVVLYEMLVGEIPFHGANEHSLAYDIVHGEPKSLSNLPSGTPPGCAPIIARALSKDPAARFGSAVEMVEALAGVRESAGYTGHLQTRSGTGERHPSVPVPAPTAARRRPALVRYGIPVLAIAAVIAAALALHVPRKIAVFFGFAEPAGARRITVFVPTVIGGSPQDQVLAAGLAEYLRLRLDEIARRSRSWVTPVDHLVSYDVREASDALRILGSNVVLSGTLKRAGDSINLTLDVINPASYRRVDSVAKSDQISNIATWQVDLVMEAAAALGLAAAELADRASLAASGTTVPGAFESYIYGLGFMTSVYSGSGLGSAESADVLASAIGAFEEAVRLDPSFTSARIDLADALRRKSAPGEDQSPALQAEAMVRAIIKTDNSLAPAHLVLGSILRGLGRNEEAAGEIESSVDLDPLSYDALIKLGNLYEDMNQPAKAEAAYRAALHARPGYWAGATYLGVFFLYQGAYDKARDEYERAARACPGNFNILNNLGAAHFKLGEFAKAIAAFERSNAVKRNPDACSNLAVLYYYSGRYADSVTMNEAAIGFGLSDYAYLIWGNLADAYRYTPGNEAKAAEAYAKAIELTGQALAADPGDARTRASLAVFLAKAGEPERARIEIESALRAKPDDSSIVLKAVIVHELTGARPRALEAVREYVRLKGPMEEIVSDPFLAGLRQDPGYADITRK